MDKEEILLKEYEFCMQYVRHHSSTYWLIFGIFMPVNTASLGAIIYSLISNSASSNHNIMPVLVTIVVVLFGTGMLLILVYLKHWLKRSNFLLQMSFERMREIETHLGMWRSWMIHGIDHWEGREKISKEDKTRLIKLYHPAKWWRDHRKSSKYKPSSRAYADGIIYTLISLWGVVIITALVLMLSNC